MVRPAIHSGAMAQHTPVLTALARIEDAQAALATTLRAAKPSRLRARPPSGEWSPLENVRHLIFAEQHHFAPFLERGFRWSTAGVPPPNRTGERRLSPIGSDPATTVDEVFEAWTKVHAVVRALSINDPDHLTPKLEGNLRHLELHSKAMHELLRG